jgi:autotransporter-associated beta strand protein
MYAQMMSKDSGAVLPEPRTSLGYLSRSRFKLMRAELLNCGGGVYFSLRTFALALASVTAASVPSFSGAAVINMVGSDDLLPTNTSFVNNEQANWPGGVTDHPVAGNEYQTAGYLIRTPSGDLDVTFEGDLLRINGGAGGDFPLTGILGLSAQNGSATIDDLRLDRGRVAITSTAFDLQGNIVVEDDGSFETFGTNNRVLTINSAMTGPGGMTITANNGNGEVIYSGGTKDYSGDTTVTGSGTLRMGAANQLPSDVSDGDLIVNDGAALQLDGSATTIQGLNDGVDSGGEVVNASVTAAELTIQGNTSSDSFFSGDLADGGTGTLSLRKLGDTRQIFSGTGFTYTGGTTIEDGQLRLAAGASLGSGAVTITGDGSGTVELDNTDIDYAVTLEGRGSDTAHIDNIAGNNTVSGPLTLQETVDGNDPTIFTIDSSGGDLDVSSDLAFTGTEGSVLNLGGASTGTVTGNINLAGGGTNTLTSGSAPARLTR